ncbi:MAG: SGNH/GDSL hydrolase family protein [Clostridia bacterium]|nr:SGNH/GDSL hydrolase family protein [Clostridia bacterium]
MSVLNSGGFTYEAENTSNQLETYEWDNTWWEKCNTPDVPRVLHIGDSISCGLRYSINLKAEDKIFFDNFGTSKALDNPLFAPSLEIFHRQQIRCDAVIFNNGLHGFHLNDETEYKDFYEKMILSLKEIFKDIPLALLLSTTVKDEAQNQRVIARNKAVLELGEKYSIPVIDMYSMSIKQTGEQFDGVHFNICAYEAIAEELIEAVKTAFPNLCK